MTNANELGCSNCGESCSEEDVAMGGLCPSCDEAAAEDLRASAEFEPWDIETCGAHSVDRDLSPTGSDLDGVRW